MASDGSVSEGSKLKSAQLLDLVRTHLTTDAGKELQTKVGFIYQINVAPKVCVLPCFSILAGLGLWNGVDLLGSRFVVVDLAAKTRFVC